MKTFPQLIFFQWTHKEQLTLFIESLSTQIEKPWKVKFQFISNVLGGGGDYKLQMPQASIHIEN
jgi:hypothetical protein